jgi:hypothetical protein
MCGGETCRLLMAARQEHAIRAYFGCHFGVVLKVADDQNRAFFGAVLPQIIDRPLYL